MYPEKLYELSIVPNYPDDELTVDCNRCMNLKNLNYYKVINLCANQLASFTK